MGKTEGRGFRIENNPLSVPCSLSYPFLYRAKLQIRGLLMRTLAFSLPFSALISALSSPSPAPLPSYPHPSPVTRTPPPVTRTSPPSPAPLPLVSLASVIPLYQGENLSRTIKQPIELTITRFPGLFRFNLIRETLTKFDGKNFP